jgi:endo-beta-N-acetylglucosaminidase D
MLVDCWVNIPHRYGIEGHFINKETTSFITLNKVEEKVALHNIKGCPSLLE